MDTPVSVRPMREYDTAEVVALWHETSRDTYRYLPSEQSYSLDSRRDFFRDHIAPTHDLFIADRGGVSVGFMAIKGSYIDRLYVHPDHQRQGVGTALIAKAIELSPAGLELFTHRQNSRARAFYERHGFEPVKFGISPPPESAPDVEYHWRPRGAVQLADTDQPTTMTGWLDLRGR